MKKLSMKVDDLRVESFSTYKAEPARRGTVNAHLGNSDFCVSIGCWNNSESGCYETLGCSFTANFECMESAGCP